MASVNGGQALLDDAQAKGITLGLKPINGVVERLDIDVMLLKNPLTFNLFLLALEALEKTKGTEKMGFFQLAGIHGIPKDLWDNVDWMNKRESDPASRGSSGYCPHGQWTFGTWHRPYLALYEQSLYAKMVTIANSFTVNRQQYIDSLQNFRLPYWDYFRPRGGRVIFPGIRNGRTTTYPRDFKIPEIFTTAKVMVKRPKGDAWDLIDNPLYQFSFIIDNVQVMPEDKWSHVNVAAQYSRSETTRGPTDGLNERINKARAPNWQTVKEQMTNEVYNDFYVYGSKKAFGSASGSVESVHDKYHGLIGDLGPHHMGTIAVSAFDPIFWMHHAQIDRWIAVWQAIHPKAKNPKSWFYNDDPPPYNVTGDLRPFRKSKTDTSETFWDSNDSEDVTDFGYTYGDLLEGGPDEVKQRFLEKYDWAGHADGTPPEDMEFLNLKPAMVYQFQNAPVAGGFTQLASGLGDSQPVLAATQAAEITSRVVSNVSQKLTSTFSKQPSDDPSNGQPLNDTQPSGYMPQLKEHVEWYIDLKVEKQALNGSFGVFYFLGENDYEPSGYMTAPHLAGFTYILANSVEACGNCEAQAAEHALVSDTTVITPMLRDYVEIGELPDLTPEHVLPFLKKELRWKAAMGTGVPVLPAQIAGLGLSISAKFVADGASVATYARYPEVIEQINSQIADENYRVPVAELPEPPVGASVV